MRIPSISLGPLAVGLALALAMAAPGCGRQDGQPPPAERSAGTPGSATSSAASPAPRERDPRLLLFDLETALGAVHASGEAYPTTSEFSLQDRWRLQRAALDEAFDEWRYESDGTTYRLTGRRAGRRFTIASPAGSAPSDSAGVDS